MNQDMLDEKIDCIMYVVMVMYGVYFLNVILLTEEFFLDVI